MKETKNKHNTVRGAEGVYRVATLLSKYNIHVAPTMGNASCVDLLAASEDGSKSIAIQVKAAGDGHADRNKKIGGKKISGKYWILGKRRPIWSNDLWYAFVDLGMHSKGDASNCQVYFIPSKWVAAFCTGIGKTLYSFVSNSIAERAAKNIDVLIKQINGNHKPVDVPQDMIWVGTNEGKTTKQVLLNLEKSRRHDNDTHGIKV